MSVKNLIRNTWLQITMRKKLFLAITVVVTLAFLVIDYSLLIYGGAYIREYFVTKEVVYRADDIYFLNLEKYKVFYPETVEQFVVLKDELSEMEGVFCSGLYYEETMMVQGNEQMALLTSDSLMKMCKVMNQNGNTPTFGTQRDYPSVIVGYNLAGQYPVGSLIVDEMSGETYQVSDILQKGSKWLDDDITFGMYYNLDNYVIKSLDTVISQDAGMLVMGNNTFCFQVDELTSGENVKQQVMDVAEKIGLEIYSIRSLLEKMQWSRRELHSDKDEIILSTVLFFTAILTMVVSSLITIYIRRRDIGIMYANGYSKREVSFMYVIETIIKIVIAFVMASAYWSINQYSIYDWRISVMPYLLAASGIIAVLLIFVSSYIPFIMIRQLKPVELIGGKE